VHHHETGQRKRLRRDGRSLFGFSFDNTDLATRLQSHWFCCKFFGNPLMA
jgi:hypothetical protein